MASDSEMFVLTPEPARQMLRIMLRGYWDEAVMSRYEDAVRAELAAANRRGGYGAFLIDATQFPIQSQPVAARHQALLVAAGKREGARVAMVMPSGLSKLQALRVASTTGQQTFETEAAALEWLFGPRPTPRNAAIG